MNRICRKCGNDISEGRLKDLPETQTSVDCSKTNRKKGFKVIKFKNILRGMAVVSRRVS